MKRLSTTELSKLSEKQRDDILAELRDEAKKNDREGQPFFLVSFGFLALVLFAPNDTIRTIAIVLQLACIVVYSVFSIRNIKLYRYGMRVTDVSIDAITKSTEAKQKLSTEQAKKGKK